MLTAIIVLVKRMLYNSKMEKGKTIIQVCPRLHHGGLERGCVDMAIAAKNAGYHSVIISNGGPLEKVVAQAGLEHFELPLHLKSPWAIRRNSQQLRKIILNCRPDLVHASSRAAIWATYFALKKLNIPFITSCHSPHSLGPLHGKKLYNKAVILGDRVIAISQFIADYLIKNYAITQDKITVIPRGIDTQYFDPNILDPIRLNQLKQEWDIPMDRLIVLMPGRITRWKGQDIFIKAIQELKDQIPILGVIVGRVDSKNYYQELKQYIQQNTLEPYIRFLGDCDEMPYTYALADITVSASRKPEAFGRVAVEAQAMKSITIATNIGAAQETILNEQTGFLIPPENPSLLAKTILNIHALTQTQQVAIKNQARENVLKEFTKNVMCEQTLNLYASCFR